ncbi:MAG: sugar phosphate isomerase/epimerase [Cyclobacteriaceae bacterium]|nr:sugar phosphate isomerase/epimerase [Cyclobacteriaceae bacterium]
MQTNRRDFLRSAALLPVAMWPLKGNDSIEKEGGLSSRVKLSLNAYSFNAPLRDGSWDLLKLIDFCRETGFEAIDPTGYYFPNYPQSPGDQYLYDFKRKAYLSGIAISGSGVRNDFTHPDKEVRREGVETVKRWVDLSVKMGCPLLRVFPGKQLTPGLERKKATGWVIEHLKECSSYAGEKGILLAMQNHNDFVKNSDQVVEILDAVNSEWLGLHLDIGSFEERDAYSEVERLIPYAFTWQVKEQVFQNGQKVKTDFKKLLTLIRDSKYHGYLPLETLGPGDPVQKVKALYKEVRNLLDEM